MLTSNPLSRRAAALMVALFVTACGGDNDDGNSSASQPPAGQPGSPEEPGKRPSQRPDPVMRCAP